MKPKTHDEDKGEDKALAEALAKVEQLKADLAEAMQRREQIHEWRRSATGDAAEALKDELAVAADRVKTIQAQQAEALRHVNELKQQHTFEVEQAHKEQKSRKKVQAAKRSRAAKERPHEADAPRRIAQAPDEPVDWEAEEAFERHLSELERQKEDAREAEELERERDYDALAREKAEARERQMARRQAKTRAREEAKAREREEERALNALERQEASLQRKAKDQEEARTRREEKQRRQAELNAQPPSGLAVFWTDLKSMVSAWLAALRSKKK